MSEPTRLKAIAQGLFVGAPVVIAGGYAGLKIAMDTLGNVVSLGVGLAAPLILLVISSFLFRSSREYRGTYTAATISGLTAAGAAAFIYGSAIPSLAN